jgi:putative ABC transport system substrate-binding protein
MRRREVLGFLGAMAAGWPLAVSAQQPVIGHMEAQPPDVAVHLAAAFREGLKSACYAEGQNVAIQYRWAHGQSIEDL